MLIDCGFFVALPVSVGLQYTFGSRGNMLHQRSIYVIFQLKGASKTSFCYLAVALPKSAKVFIGATSK
jgi:hypothetical protein